MCVCGSSSRNRAAWQPAQQHCLAAVAFEAVSAAALRVWGWRLLLLCSSGSWAVCVLQQQESRVLCSLSMVGPASGVLSIWQVHAGVLHDGVGRSAHSKLCGCGQFAFIDGICARSAQVVCVTRGLVCWSPLPGLLTLPLTNMESSVHAFCRANITPQAAVVLDCLNLRFGFLECTRRCQRVLCWLAVM